MSARQSTPSKNSLEHYWMPFTANRQFKAAPRIVIAAEGMYYTASTGQKVLDGTAGLWCCAAGHARPKISEAIAKQVRELDYAPAFQMGHPQAFELAARLAQLMPGSLDHVFFTNSGSESVETALKIAIAYHRLRGEAQRVRLIGRERGYHGVNFGGMSVGGMTANRKMFGALVSGVDHLRHTHGDSRNLFVKGQPDHGAEFAEDLERLCALHDPSTIAAVIVEPVQGSAGVIVPPKGYLKRLREICTKHGILLIFDEVITGYGRLGTPFAVDYFGVEPDIVATAKAITNGVIPMGAVFASKAIFDTFMQGPENAIELFHGYTASANPIACAAALATLDTYAEEGLLTRAAELNDYWADAAHSLKGLPFVADIRTIGLVAAIELNSREGKIGARAFETYLKCFEAGVLIRVTGDVIALSPPLIIEKAQIDHLFETLGSILKAIP
jgi:beta-alanine--pyruvate transaminase